MQMRVTNKHSNDGVYQRILQCFAFCFLHLLREGKFKNSSNRINVTKALKKKPKHQ